MIQTNIVSTTKSIIAENAKVRLETVTNPDMNKLTNKSLLRNLIPDGWDEKVFEYDNRFYVNLSISKSISKTEEFYMTKLIASELGKDNMVMPHVAINTNNSSSISILLKKSNYEEVSV